jgi:pantoate--beta-alanine ligase
MQEMQDFSEKIRAQGKRLAFVPTMGFLHEGHLELMRVGKRRGDFLVVSIFINPTQFGPGEDFEDYPRDLAADKKKLTAVGTDVLFAPPVGAMYPQGFQTTVHVKEVTRNLCGLSRPTHFEGVTTVVAKLFNIVRPHVAIFGEKDYQQLVAIRTMARDLSFDVEVVGVPMVRESDGLAMSSRNTYLSKKERQSALSLNRSLTRASELFSQGEQRSERIIAAVREIIEREPSTSIDYIKVCDAKTLEDIETMAGEALVALAVWVGRARLIDNVVLKAADQRKGA